MAETKIVKRNLGKRGCAYFLMRRGWFGLWWDVSYPPGGNYGYIASRDPRNIIQISEWLFDCTPNNAQEALEDV